MPAMTVHYRSRARDHEVIDRGKDEIVRLGKAVGEPLDDRPFMMPLGASLHYQGTTRLGAADDGSSVCSPEGEVWGVPGLFVAGNGVIPTVDRVQPDADGGRARRARRPRSSRNWQTADEVLLMSDSDIRV